MKTMKISLINDPIHGMIVVPPFVVDVIHSALFQRLGRVRQLGCLDRAWPSAKHSRLEHSLGTMHLALRVADYLNMGAISVDLREAFVLASLLHDIGHGPFSHVFESAIEGTSLNELFGNHDTFRFAVLEHLPLSDKHRRNVVAVWRCEPEFQVAHTLLEGVAGVDRMDYILRDSYHTTPQRRLHNTCIDSIIYHTSIKDNRVVYNEKALKYIGHLLRERAYLYTEVYTHKKSCASEMLLRHAFRNADFQKLVAPLLAPARFEQFDDDFVRQCAWHDTAYALPIRRFVRAQLPTALVTDCAESTERYSLVKDGMQDAEFDRTKLVLPDDWVCDWNIPNATVNFYFLRREIESL